jgi:Xaa-Pro aminopeptidase
MRRLGAEGTSYPIWVCSGPNTHQSLCRSTDRRIKRNELVQLTFGARHLGYCGNMCRPFAIGKMPDRARQLASVALEGVHAALTDIRPGATARSVFQHYYDILAAHGFEEFTLYGPAHGTGSSEVEGLWLGAGSDTVIRPGMQFNIDIWLNDGEYGMRFEDGIVVTETGIEELTSYRREIIEL